MCCAPGGSPPALARRPCVGVFMRCTLSVLSGGCLADALFGHRGHLCGTFRENPKPSSTGAECYTPLGLPFPHLPHWSPGVSVRAPRGGGGVPPQGGFGLRFPGDGRSPAPFRGFVITLVRSVVNWLFKYFARFKCGLLAFFR